MCQGERLLLLLLPYMIGCIMFLTILRIYGTILLLPRWFPGIFHR
jgi:hypothetical protein